MLSLLAFRVYLRLLIVILNVRDYALTYFISLHLNVVVALCLDLLVLSEIEVRSGLIPLSGMRV